MKNKILAVFVMFVMVLSTVVLISEDNKVLATSGGGAGGTEEMGFDFDYIFNKTETLSETIYEAYNETDIKKGRFYGSKGERYAKDKIVNWMQNLNLSTTTEKIQNIESGFDNEAPSINLTENIDINDYGITINNVDTGNSTNLTDFYVRPMWNWRFLRGIIELWKDTNRVENNTEGLNLLGSLFNLTVAFFQDRYDRIFNDSRLTKNIKYENLTLFPRPDNNAWFTEALENETTNLTNNESIVDLATFLDCFLPKFQEYHNFTFGELNISYATERLGWFVDEWYNSSRCDCGFLYIGEDLSFNPNATKRNSIYRWVIEDLLAEHPSMEDYKEYILNAKSIIEHMMWNITFGNLYKGLILYNFDNDTYNMQNGLLDPSHNLYINGSIGKQIINSDISDYKVTFWINQSLNKSIDSYNVIGELDGVDNNKTAIIGCLYDSWWNQGTGDSAIGMAIVLGIAKYMKDHNITSKYKIKFIGFSGEESALRGAFYYEKLHRSDKNNTVIMIDLNQLGFSHPGPPLILNLINHNASLYSTYSAIANLTQYEDRINEETTTLNVTDFPIPSDYTPFHEISGINTICFLKDLSWIYHHRSGDNHLKGDSMAHYNEVDVNLTTELIWNVTRYFCVNPDGWFESMEYDYIDTDDDGIYLDSIRVNFTAKTILPHDIHMNNISLIRNDTGLVEVINIMNYTLNSTGKNLSITVTLPEESESGCYHMFFQLLNSTGFIDYTLNSSGVYWNTSFTSDSKYLHPYNYNLIVPDITNVNVSPTTIGYGNNVSISADVSTNASSNISNVKINLTYPDSTFQSISMNNTNGTTYQYVFNNTWQHGKYNFYIWANDENGNESGSSLYNFSVDVELSISVCTIKDDYDGNETINLTDPPLKLNKIGYKFLDIDEVLHIWNSYDSYYFNTSNGVQFTNHMNDYWSHNVLMLGYYNNDVWNLMYRTDNLSGFNKNITSDNKTFVNATLWKDLTYQGFDFRLAIRYYLGVDDNELTVIPYIKNIDDENITYNLGFAWELKDIQVDMTSSGDYIEINGTSYYLNQTLDESYTNLDIPCYYIKEDKSENNFESLYLRWDNNLNYKVEVESKTGQYNAPITLGIKIGTLSVGQEKYTELFWHDASEKTFYFDGYNVAEAWASNPGYMVDGNESNYASTTIPDDIERLNNNTCNGTYYGNISKVEIRCKAYYTGSVNDIILTPYYNGVTTGDNCYFTPTGSGQWSQWFNLSGDESDWPIWTWTKVKNLDCIVVANDSRFSFTLYCSKIEIRVTYTPNNISSISNPIPETGSIGIGISPTLSVTVSDADNDDMTITWYSNSSGSWQIFGTNNSVSNGTYNQTFSNATVNGQWWYWNVSVDDGDIVNTSDVFSFYTGYESKIYNSGNTNISGYLSIYFEYYNETSESWEGDFKVINSTYIVINSGEKLGLDTIFNPENVSTSSFTHGNGTYRVFVVLKDPYCNILLDGTLGTCKGETEIKAWYEFTVTFE